MNDILSTLKFEEYEHDLSQVSSNESSDANLSIKLARLEDRVMKLIEFVMNDITELKEIGRQKKESKRKAMESNKENSNVDPWKCRIYVGNISPSSSIEEVKVMFHKFGKVNGAFFFRYFDTCRNAFVEFSDYSSVEKALKSLNFLDGRLLTVGKAKRRDDHPKNESRTLKARNNDLRVMRYRPY